MAATAQALVRLGLQRGLSRLVARTEGSIPVHCGRVPLEMDMGVPYERHLFLGLTDRDVLGVFEHFLRPGDVVVDVGSNIGFHAAFMANLVGVHGRVYAFEPDAVMYCRLVRMVAANPLRNIKSIPAAASSEDGNAIFFQSSVHSLSSLRRCWSPETTMREVCVVVRRLDYFLNEHDCKHIRLIKIDVEGHERAVLDGLQDTLARRAVDVLLFEVTPPNHRAFDGDISDILDMLERHGYVTWGLSVRGLLPRRQFEENLSLLAPSYNLLAVQESHE